MKEYLVILKDGKEYIIAGKSLAINATATVIYGENNNIIASIPSDSYLCISQKDSISKNLKNVTAKQF